MSVYRVTSLDISDHISVGAVCDIKKDNPGEKRPKGGQEEHVLELQKAPKGGPLQSTDV